jgi:hypothetical protein
MENESIMLNRKTVQFFAIRRKMSIYSSPQVENPIAYTRFKNMLCTTFEVEKAEDLPLKKVEYVFNIFKYNQDFTFSDPDERLSNFLILTASLYSIKKEEKICYISPTYFYANQAARMRDCYLRGLGAPKEAAFPTVIPGMLEYEACVRASSVVFMHGKDFSDYLPAGWSGRKIIQIFPGENVPVDPRKPSSCWYDTCD